MRIFFAFLFLIGVSTSCSTTTNSDKLTSEEELEMVVSINSLMDEQQDCWNQGDIDCFMKHYWKSDELMFVGKNITKGWQNTLDNYKKGYPDKQAMGQLTFNNISVEPMSKTHCFVVGEWSLERDGIENLGGHYSLVWRINENGEWVIVIDHST